MEWKNRIAVLNHHERLSPRVFFEIQALLLEGFDAEIYNWVGKNEELMNISLENNMSVHNILLSRPKGKLRIIFYLPILYYNLLKRFRKRHFDIVHCTHLYFLPLALILKSVNKASVVYDAYELYSSDFGGYFPRFSKYIRKLTELIENTLASKADLILTIDSRDGFLEKRYRRFNRYVEVLYNVPNDTFQYDRMLLNDIKSKYRGRKIIVSMGKISPQKGLFKSLQATKVIKSKYPEVLLLLIGDFWVNDLVLSTFVKEYGLEGNVEIKTWLPYDEMMHYLKCADVACALYQPTLPRYHLVSRGTARKIFTFMKASLPIVGPNFGEIASVVAEEKCGILVDSSDYQKIAEAILELLNNPDKAKEFGKNGKKAIHQKYNWESEKRKLLRAYSSMVKMSNTL